MFDTLPEAVEYARGLVSRGVVTKASPAAVGWARDGTKVLWYVVPRGWTWPEGFVSQLLFPEGEV